MSIDQREQIKLISSALMRVLLGFSGAALTIVFYMQRDETQEFRNEVKKSFEVIEKNYRESSESMEEIKSDVRLIDYRLKQLEK